MSNFNRQLQTGKVAESKIAAWMRYKRRCIIMPVYEIEKSWSKGPQLFTPGESLIAPDMLVIKDAAYWVEAKHKTVFTWHRKTGKWVTGIDFKHYRHYFKVQQETRWPVWILFLHSQFLPDKRDLDQGCPIQCPTGLYGRALSELLFSENHRVPPSNCTGGYGNSGMVYWAEENLRKMATLTDVEEAYNALSRPQWKATELLPVQPELLAT